ncbi:BRO-N domain-containing protein [Pseudomonas abietaniphila]|uniref:BRO family, N-terminal domain n=1 Tax=Pseudomonas abietaniphila TaxID=89065 RepID=A0A1G8KBK6_9PSED|nr:Bro-N domain-containing protein [Pseudomonas abietaniphila]SDI40814.1 BRO family, N-terminal domain [Pseudomonas abietaniphila]
MKHLIPFNFKGADIRVITDSQGEPWFVAGDVSTVLEYSEASAMTRHLDEDEKGLSIVQTLGGDQEMVVISESGLYSAVLLSRKPQAKPFKRWVTGEVLPSIRKTGSYQRPMTPGEQLLANAQAVITIERQQAQQQVALERIERRVEDLSQTTVWDHCPQNCQSLTRIKETMLKRHGLSGAVVDFVLKQWPSQPNPAGMVRNGHEEALGSQYLVWSKSHVTAAFHRFVSESTMVTATQATHPYFEGRFRLVQKAKS